MGCDMAGTGKPITAGGLAVVLAALAISAGCGGGGSVAATPAASDDTAPPRITAISGVTDGQTVVGSAVITATATDDVGIASFKLAIDGETLVDAALSTIYFSWDVRKVLIGDHELVFTAADAAGNSDTRTLQVTVDSGITITPEQPAGEQTPTTESPETQWPETEPPESEPPASQPPMEYEPPEVDEPEVEPTPPTAPETLKIPPMDPALLDPSDSAPPTLIVGGLAEGKRLYEVTHVSATALDDTGVNLVGFVVDGSLLAYREGSSLSVDWDTRLWDDGPITVGFILRDNGGGLYQAYYNVVIDNTTEHDPPVLTLTGFDEQCVTGVHELHVHGEDASGVAWIKLKFQQRLLDSQGLDVGPGPDSFEVLENSGELVYPWDTTLKPDYKYIISAWAEDVNGVPCHTPSYDIWTTNTVVLTGNVRAQNEQWLGESLVCLLEPEFSGDYDRLPDQPGCLAFAWTGFQGDFALPAIPFGPKQLYLRCGGTSQLTDVEVPELVEPLPRFDVGEAAIMLARHGGAGGGSRGSNSHTAKVGLVSGDHDDLIAMFSTAETHWWMGYNIGDWVGYDGNDSLDDESKDFRDVLHSETDGHHDLWREAHTLFIDSGNHYEHEILEDEALANALRNWVEDGGRLVVIGDSYDFVEQLWPAKIDFAGDSGIDGLGPVAEQIDAAQIAPGWMDPDDPTRTAEVTCLVQEVLNGWYDGTDGLIYRYNGHSVPETYPLLVMWKNYEDPSLNYDYTTQTLPVEVRGFIDHWPVIERVADDMQVWMTLKQAPTDDVPAGTPVEVSFYAGLGKVFVITHLLYDQQSEITPGLWGALAPLANDKLN